MQETPEAKTGRELLRYPNPITGEICDFGRCNNCLKCLADRFMQERHIKRLGMYRGFEIGWRHGYPPRLTPCWRGPNDLKWTEGCSAGTEIAEATKIAIACVDYRYRVEAWEFENGREYSAIDDGPLPAN
jgi:hypothetical protein